MPCPLKEKVMLQFYYNFCGVVYRWTERDLWTEDGERIAVTHVPPVVERALRQLLADNDLL